MMYAGTVQWCKSMDTVDDYHDNDMEMTWHEFGPKPILSALSRNILLLVNLLSVNLFVFDFSLQRNFLMYTNV